MGSSRLATCRRGLGCLLLLLIVYGSTAAAAHSHGLATSNRPGVTAISDAGGSQSSDKSNSHQKECSMCQFQQQLFGSLVQAPLFARSPLVEIAFASTLSVFHPSTPTTPTSGRAPPFNQA